MSNNRGCWIVCAKPTTSPSRLMLSAAGILLPAVVVSELELKGYVFEQAGLPPRPAGQRAAGARAPRPIHWPALAPPSAAIASPPAALWAGAVRTCDALSDS